VLWLLEDSFPFSGPELFPFLSERCDGPVDLESFFSDFSDEPDEPLEFDLPLFEEEDVLPPPEPPLGLEVLPDVPDEALDGPLMLSSSIVAYPYFRRDKKNVARGCPSRLTKQKAKQSFGYFHATIRARRTQRGREPSARRKMRANR
jgi:hypothetical protein